tara:strand:+ start:2045 stop:3850 length:1806 start_codon:yes stop_codon:yes gene_type:complete
MFIKFNKFLLISLLFFPLFVSAAGPTVLTDEQEALLLTLPPDQRDSVKSKIGQVEEGKDEVEEIFEERRLLIERPELKDLESQKGYCKKCIYGYNLFRFSPTTFAPSNKIPASSSYVLGPGDILNLNYYGNDKINKKVSVSRDGSIDLPLLGPVVLSGLTFSEAKDFLKNKVSSDLIGTQISITLDSLRSISVYILGEAYKPGSYTVSALSTITNVLFATGGVNENGSLRNIELRRNGKLIKTFDFYDLLLKADTSSDARIEDGDVIFIPFIANRVSLNGSFKRPGTYEFKPGETVRDVIELAGGYSSYIDLNPRLYLGTLNTNTKIKENLLIDIAKIDSIQIKNNDSLNVSSLSGINQETFKIEGEVKYPGVYAIQKNDTLLDIIDRAGGYTERAYSRGAIFTRLDVAKSQKQAFLKSADRLEETIANALVGDSVQLDEFSLTAISKIIDKLRKVEPIGRQVVDVNYLRLKTDPLLAFEVFDGDTLTIPRRQSSVHIVGEVTNPVTLMYDPELSIKGYISRAGGLTPAADSSRTLVITPDGITKVYRNSVFGRGDNILPGSTVVVSRSTRPFDAISITKIITPILADLATSAAAIAAISD